MYTVFKTLVACLLVAALAAPAASPSIGFAMSRGSIRLDQKEISGNASLFDGSVVETGRSASELHLEGGPWVALSAGAKSKVYRDRLVLEQGRAEVMDAAVYQIEAAGLLVHAERTGTIVRVAANGSRRVLVSAIAGAANVTTGPGVLLARVAEGASLEFEPQPGAAAPAHVTGVLQNRDGRFLLKDEITGVTVEIEGTGMSSYIGKRVAVTGSTVMGIQPAKPADQSIRMNAIHLAGNAPGASRFTGGTKALLSGVAIAGATSAVAVSLGRKEEKKTPVSR